jgi:hypothetical protein
MSRADTKQNTYRISLLLSLTYRAGLLTLEDSETHSCAQFVDTGLTEREQMRKRKEESSEQSRTSAEPEILSPESGDEVYSRIEKQMRERWH